MCPGIFTCRILRLPFPSARKTYPYRMGSYLESSDQGSGHLTGPRDAPVEFVPMNDRDRFVADHALGAARLVVRNFPCQLPNEKFLEEISHAIDANSNACVFER